MKNTGRWWWGLGEMLKIMFSLAKLICEPSLHIITNQLSDQIIDVSQRKLQIHKQTQVTD